MAKTVKKRKIAALLPKRAPKKTGRRGVKPLDEKEDFGKPTKQQLLKDAAKQARLPGMEDASISAIETAAYEYDNVKKRRMKLLEQEIELKAALRAIMQKHTTKSTYRHDDVLVILTPPKEGGVKVVIGDEEKLDAVQKAAQATDTSTVETQTVSTEEDEANAKAMAEANTGSGF